MLVRVAYAALSPIDGYLAVLYELLRGRGQVPGVDGVGRVYRLGVGVSGFREGDCVAQASSVDGLPGFEVEGWLASIRAAPSSSIARLDCRPEFTFTFTCGVGAAAAMIARRELVVIGCGLAGFSAAFYAAQSGYAYRLYCLDRSGLRHASRLGLEAALLRSLEPGMLEGVDVFLSTIDPRAKSIVEASKPSTLILHPVYRIEPRPSPASSRIVLIEDAPVFEGARLSHRLVEELDVPVVEFSRLSRLPEKPVIVSMQA